MLKFIKWSISWEAPDWVASVMAMFMLVLFYAIYIFNLIVLSKGYWIVPLITFVILPLYFSIKEYIKRE